MHLSMFKMLTQKLFLTLLLLIAIANFSFSQSPNSATKKFALGINASTDLCYRWLSNNDKSGSSQMLIDSRNAGETPRIAYTLGIVGQLELRPTRMLEVGLQYAKMGYSAGIILPSNVIMKGFVQPSPFNPSGKPIERFRVINEFTYLEVPISLVYEKQYASYSIFTRFGVVPGYLVSSTVYDKFVFTDGSRAKTRPVKAFNEFNNINLSSLVSFGTAYQLRNEFKIRVETNLKYGLLKIIDSPITGRLWSSGINVSCIKSF